MLITSKRAGSMRKTRKIKPHEYGQAIRTLDDGNEICLNTAAGIREYKRRTLEMAKRQGGKCAIGWHPFTEADPPVFGHESSRWNRDDRIEVDGKWKNAALCAFCNGLQGSRRYAWEDGLYLPVFENRRSG